MDREEKIAALLSVENGTEKISGLVPKILLDRMIAAYRKKVGAVREHGLKSQALFYFAARGVVDWEDQHREDDLRKKSSRRSLDDSAPK